MLVAALADGFVETGGEKIEAGVVGETEGEFFPEEAAAGDFFHHGRGSAGERDLEHVSGIVAIAFGEAVDFRRAAIPCLGSDLFGAMPIAERDVVDGVCREAGKVDPIDHCGRALFILLHRPEPLDGAVRQHDAGQIRR